jgi:CRISPR-associated protein (TIGR02710 family)
MPEDLQALWEAYKQAIRSGGDPQALYREMVWPRLLARWREAPQVHPEPEAFAVSVHTLGTSPEATILAILGAGAERVYVLHTRESAQYLDRLEKDTGRPIQAIEVGKSDVAAIYREVKRLLDRHGDVPLALDLTSGTKAMSAGLAAAGFFFRRFYPKVRVVYVDNEDYDPELRRPRAGTERLIILKDPHEALGEVDALFAKEFYQKGEFARAAAYFGGMVGRTGNQGWSLYQALTEMYEAWHALDFAEAHRKGKSLLARLSENAWLDHPFNQNRASLRSQVALLGAVSDFLRTQDLGRREGVYGLARSLRLLSEREERPVLAALYAYRALELLLQERLLAHYGRKAEEPGLTPEEGARLRKVLSEITRKPEEEVELPQKLGLLSLLALLRALEDPLLSRKPLNNLQGLAGVLQARNSALLIHGLDVPREAQIRPLRELVQELLQDLEARLRREGSGLLSVSLEPVPLGF